MSKAKLPQHIQGAMDRWVEQAIPPGGFLTAVLSNNLRGAFGCADHINLQHMQEIVMYCYWEIPGNCWGSRESVAAWKGTKATE
ncbi:hypothetical protein LCGC14_0686010 [marine sediment metagenome]|uniref:Uncharacterized protein n=1 Tax=marine sediment metagenome TaxID=412755 RepID=A0A0F9TUT7_9ZZZZ